jgi:hypothetical protein
MRGVSLKPRRKRIADLSTRSYEEIRVELDRKLGIKMSLSRVQQICRRAERKIAMELLGVK